MKSIASGCSVLALLAVSACSSSPAILAPEAAPQATAEAVTVPADPDATETVANVDDESGLAGIEHEGQQQRTCKKRRRTGSKIRRTRCVNNGPQSVRETTVIDPTAYGVPGNADRIPPGVFNQQ